MTAPRTTARGPETTLETTVETVSWPNFASDQAVPASSAPRLTTPFRRRLPRFIRAKRSHRPPLALQERDLDLLRTAYEYRLITTPQYLLLYADESRDAIYRRLQKLFHHGYVDRIGRNPNAPLVYALGSRGGEVLGVSCRKEVGDPYLLHQLMIGDFRVTLALASRGQGVTVAWRDIGEGSPIKPDGFFDLQFPDRPDGRNRAFFFLEADRSTMTSRRFMAKLLAYAHWRAQGGHTAKFGIKNFRLLTVTKSEERMRNLIGLVVRTEALQGIQPALWFTSQNRFTPSQPSSIFAPIWETPGEPEVLQSLFP